MIKIGIIGTSEGNGHPYSFSAIFNGYNQTAMKESGWINIYNYLENEPKENFGIPNARITHVWSQDPQEIIKISQASNVPNLCKNYEEMLDKVDAVIIARDDWRSHYPIAKTFLQADKFVFIDKPLSLNDVECNYFENFIQSGKLMSFSSLHFATELDDLRAKIQHFGKIKLIRGITPKNWETYGIHLLDGISGVLKFSPTQITKNICSHESFYINTKEGFLIQIDCLGFMQYPMLQLEFFSEENYYKANCLNAFSSFKRMLTYFVQMIEGKTDIPTNLHTLKQMKILQKGMNA
ncbi:Gfo/Idh/MocA family oxidoreductase [Helicobacter kayseriensis]|uniref:Gfo/Idh/MocA family oxidoreductase n=1 Tax=Helicobacter kayseriensis TaxID=2905877 RepID=UPI001E4D5804|nr:Gfo/Idh/MocA family oxidoreductase [Helicobacter kayseriensis]MCE3046665.1 Gfo/Idh/MocA family oxidoreductase [Helicobacter kayseriensis]MCE3048033.1 Gfo/Idh/MocA family oxidoreductase [Helicobacter kayseriensis]